MKKNFLNLMKVAVLGGMVSLYSCGGASEQKSEAANDDAKTEEVATENATEEPAAVNEEAVEEQASETAELDLTKGKEVYDKTCKVCHQENGEGVAGAFPPLAKSDYLLADKSRAMKEIKEGLSGEITVNGQRYNSTMAPNNLTDEEIVAVTNYILNSWGNEGGTVTIDDLK
jgi:nitrite reductase (NO-forming)